MASRGFTSRKRERRAKVMASRGFTSRKRKRRAMTLARRSRFRLVKHLLTLPARKTYTLIPLLWRRVGQILHAVSPGHNLLGQLDTQGRGLGGRLAVPRCGGNDECPASVHSHDRGGREGLLDRGELYERNHLAGRVADEQHFQVLDVTGELWLGLDSHR